MNKEAKIRSFLSDNALGVLNSYSQIFFSNHKIFAFLLLLVTFFDFWAGLCGVISILVANSVAWFIGLNKAQVRSGSLSFNSLFVGLGVGVYFEPSIELFILLIFSSILCLLFTISVRGILQKYGLPYLSIPFLFTVWVITLSSRDFKTLEISERGIYTLNEMYRWGGGYLVEIYNWFNNLDLHESIIIYFKSLGGVFFQYHIFAGILVAIGLLIYSRIAFLLSLIGFFSSYFYYSFIGENFIELSYNYIGFNFILSAIALGGFYIIPSRYSFLWVVLLTPVISFLISGFSAIFSIFQLSIYSLPFNFVVILFLYLLKFREFKNTNPELVVYQEFSPEKNLYSSINSKERFQLHQYFPIRLPVIGKWMVTQGHYGAITHKKDWSHAWDLEIEDEDRKLFRNNGINVEDYYCYNQPIYAPADGQIEEILNGIEDNLIGEINIQENWGNTIIIKHLYGLYSKISHIKKDEIYVVKGQIVKKGDIIARVGNSGRSPQPHLHFQIQAYPYIGSTTLYYPISHYILHKANHQYELKSFSIPSKDDIISNIQINDTLDKSFMFIPGKKLCFDVEDIRRKIHEEIQWDIRVDIYNQMYIYCASTHSRAYFKSDLDIHYFTYFEGDKKSILYHFYLASFKLIKGFYKDIEIKDYYPNQLFSNNMLMYIQDLMAPFIILIRAKYELRYDKIEEYFSESTVFLSSKSELQLFGRQIKKNEYRFKLHKNKIEEFYINTKRHNYIVRWKEYGEVY